MHWPKFNLIEMVIKDMTKPKGLSLYEGVESKFETIQNI